MFDLFILNTLKGIWSSTLFQLLMITIVTDILLGVLVSIKQKRLVSNVAASGIAKKSGELIAATYISFVAITTNQHYLSDVGLGIIIGTEILSIVELLAILGIKGIEKVLEPIAKNALQEKKEKYGITPKERTEQTNETEEPNK